MLTSSESEGDKVFVKPPPLPPSGLNQLGGAIDHVTQAEQLTVALLVHNCRNAK